MNDQFKEKVLAETRRIGDELIARAHRHRKGIYWKTMSLDPDRQVHWLESPTIYSGASGISLFFLEFFRQTREQRYLDAAVEAMRWAVWYCRENPTDYYAFYTGRMGVSFALLRLYRLTGEAGYLEQAMEIARSSTDFLAISNPIDDLIGGTSGTLLGLLHLHAVVRKDWLLEIIDRFIKHLLDSAHMGPSGVYWDRSSMNIGGLCGFSHGAAGVGFVFLELGRYFRNEAFYRLAARAFDYEMNYFDEEKNNWRDLRKGIFSHDDQELHEKAFLEGDLDFFTTTGDMNAWCHGAAGVGLSRLRAYELWEQPVYADLVRRAIEKTRTTDIDADNPRPGFILCHGGGGNAELFLEAYRAFRDDRYLSLAQEVARQSLGFREENGYYFSGYRDANNDEDLSLFMGNAGIGYFYLRVLDPLQVPSILLPRLEADPLTSLSGRENDACPHINISIGGIGKSILNRYFNRTITLVERLAPGGLDDYLNRHCRRYEGELKKLFSEFMEMAIPRFPLSQQEVVNEILTLEKEKLRMDESAGSHSLMSIRHQVRTVAGEKLVRLEDTGILDLELALAPEVVVKTSRWNWELESEALWPGNLETEADEFFLLLKPTAMGVVEEPLSPFSYVVLTEFEEARPVKDIIPDVVDAFESLSPEEERILQNKIIEQVRAALSSAILLPL